MARITFREAGGEEHTIDIANGLSIMEGAVRNMVPGIDADCGGACSCATCMIYVPAEWLDRLPKKESAEEDMLQFCPHVDERSRLSCQISVTDALDGLHVSLPESQH
jgi:2Fe-2S ferredoxin